jgi:arylsulfatase A-like enzyme
MVDAFYRWDGFSYYASFPEFLPGVALASILWSIVAVITALAIWLLLNVYDLLRKKAGIKFNSELMLFLAGIFLLSGILAWKGKKIIWPDVRTSIEIKIAVLVAVAIVSVFLSILFRNRAGKYLGIIQENITPLVWLFGIFVLLSIPLVGYHTVSSGQDKMINGLPNIILVTFDALTARNMSVYGYKKNTTPFITEWAREAVLFSYAESESNFTTPSTASLMTGKRVWTHQTYQIEGTPVKSHDESLPALLKKNGYYNMAFIVNPHTSVEILGMADSFDIAPISVDFSKPATLVGLHFGYLEAFLSRSFGNKIRLHKWVLKNDFILGKLLRLLSNDFYSTTVPPEKAFNRFLKEVGADIHSPFFAWIHVLPPHDPYLPSESFKRYFNPSDNLRSFKAQQKIKDESYKYLFDYLKLPEEMQSDVDLLKDYYDEFIRYCDKQFEDFIVQLRKREEIKNTIVILTSDHGESFEHGYFTHGGPFLYEQVTHIPLIFKEPGQSDGKVIEQIVEQIDIPATILDLVGIEVPSWMEGRSLVPLMRGERLPNRPAFSMNLEGNPSRGHQISKGSIALWEGDYKLIHYLEREESLLFNLKRDPDELSNLFGAEPDKGKHLLGLIQNKLKMVNEEIGRK